MDIRTGSLAGTKNAPSGPGEPVVQLAFPAPDTLRAAEAFQVGSSDVGDDAVVGFRDRAEQGDLPHALAPISTMPNSTSRVIASRVSGTPMWLFRLPRVA